jgi:hypothetical protein
MPLASQVNRMDCATSHHSPDFLPSDIDKAMHFCQKESEETIKKAKESKR